MSQAPKQSPKWKLFWKESSVLVAHTLLAGFYLRIAHVLNEYYRAPVLASCFLLISLAFAVPLCVNLFDLWARTIASVREESVAENILKLSIAIHRRLFGTKNAYYSEKKAMLASLQFDMDRLDEASESFKESFESYQQSLVKIPWLHPCYSDYLKLLATSGDTSTAEKIKQVLKFSHRLAVGQKLVITLFTVSVVAFLTQVQFTERDIAKHNAHGQTLVALKEISALAKFESSLLGEYAACKVYKDYALAFEESNGQMNEMDWCTDKALSSLKQSGIKDDYVNVLLLNLKAKASLADRKPALATNYLKSAAEISMNWDKNQLARNAYDAAYEREKSLISLAEIYRNQGEYEKAEPLYKKLLGFKSEKINLSEMKPTFFDPVELIDRLHKLQHIEVKLGKKDEAIKLQQKACAILEKSVKTLTASSKSSPVCDFGIREAARELDVCSIMLQEAGREKESGAYRQRADSLRAKHQNQLRLAPDQQDSIVDASTRLTNELLSVKYRAGDWKKSLDQLLNEDLRSQKARGALEKLPWFDAGSLKAESQGSRNTRPKRRLEVEIFPLSISNNREGEGIAVDVQGTVRIYSANSAEAEEQKFGFAYVLKAQNKDRPPSVEDLMDNQALAHYQLD